MNHVPSYVKKRMISMVCDPVYTIDIKPFAMLAQHFLEIFTFVLDNEIVIKSPKLEHGILQLLAS